MLTRFWKRFSKHRPAPRSDYWDLGLALAVFLLLGLASVASAHEIVILPTSDDHGVVPIITGSDHLSASPAELDFGAMSPGESKTLYLDLTNTSQRTVTVTPSVAAPFGLSPSGPSTILPGATLQLSVTASPTSPQVLDTDLDLTVSHERIRRDHQESVRLVGTTLQPPQLQIDLPEFGLTNVTAFDFGFVTYQTYPRDGAPSFEVVIRNVGDPALTETATNVLIGGGIGGSFPALGNCYWSNPISEVCVASQAGNGVYGDIPPGGSITTTWRLFPIDSDWFAHTYLIQAQNVPQIDFELTGGFVPFSLPDGPFLNAQTGGLVALQAAAQAKANPSAYQGLGRSTDPTGPDPLKSFVPEGFDPRALFAAGEADNVDARTGNVVISIPLGGAQPARAGLAYDLQLVVNSRIWKRETNWGLPTDVDLPDGPNAGRILAKFEALNALFPNPAYNAAPGVSLHMGRLAPPLHFDNTDWYTLDIDNPSILDYEKVVNSGQRWLYIDPSGHEHAFYLKMHGDEPLLSTAGLANYGEATVLYTRDESYLRLRIESTTVGGQEKRFAWLDLPNGQSHLFEEQANRHPTLGDSWILTRMEDRFGNAVTIDYTNTRWRIRTGRVTRTGSDPIGTVAHDGWRETKVYFDSAGRPTSVEHEGIGGTSANRRKYQFSYSAAQTVERPTRSGFHTLLRAMKPGFDTTLSLRTLDSITQPDGSTWELDWRINAAGREILLDGYTMPTGADVNYQHATVYPASRDCGNRGKVEPVFGVVRRWVTDDGATVADRRFLRQFRTPPGFTQNLCQTHAQDFSNHAPRAEHRVAIWSQQQNGLSTVSLQHFSDYPFTSGPNGWTDRERSVPFTRSTPDPLGGGRQLSSRTYSCAFNVGAGPTIGFDATSITADEVGDEIEDLLGSCTLKQSTYARFDVERETRCSSKNPDCVQNFRKVDERVVFEDDGDRWIRSEVSDFDGVGNYRSRSVFSNFDPAQPTNDAIQINFRDHNPDLPTLTLDAQYRVVGNYSEPDNWIFHDYGISWTEDASGLKRGGEAVFDANGLLRLERTWRLGGLGTKDIVVKSAYNPQGELQKQRYFGADVYGCSGGNLPTAGWANGSAPWNNPDWNETCQDYSVEYRQTHGVLSEQYVTHTTERQVDREIDPRTGWTLSDTLDSGEKINFGYDLMGRITSSTRSHAANQTYAYTRPGGRWRATVKTYRKGVTTGTPIRTYVADFDGLGRLVREEGPGYDGTAIARSTDYHQGGGVRRFNSLDFPNKWTTFDYDYRGRLLTRTNPDGSTVINRYWGDRELRVRTKVDTIAGRQNADTYLVNDGLGRLTRVTLPEGIVTEFNYDPLGQLTTATRGNQVKTYGTDGRGFRTSEAIPERKRSNGTQVTSFYSLFDTRGNAGRITEGSRVTDLDYDDLGRTTAVTVNGLAIKTFVFGQENEGSSHGQLVEAVRYNHRDTATSGLGGPGVWKVTSTFEHDAAARASARSTRVTNQRVGFPETGTTFRQTWLYDDLGNVEFANYPVVTEPAAQVGLLPTRSADPQYAQGHYLTKVVMPGISSMAADFTYHRSGLVASVIHAGTAGNDVYGIDSSGEPRWSSISLAGGVRNLGSLTYDPSGNITALGSDSFHYDRNNRLTRAYVQASNQTYNYAYDPYDNHAGSYFGTADPTNNRLTGGSTTYDDWGNLTQASGIPVIYDELDKVAAIQYSTYTELSIYDHNDLRVLFMGQDEAQSGRPTWTFRDANGRVMREVSGLGSAMRWEKDYLYGAGRMVSSFDRFGVRRHYHTDHLGTSRYVSTHNGGGQSLSYRPFGAAIGSTAGERGVGFASHEQQDSAFTTYMRGRTYVQGLGRFMQVDPARSTWNSYTYGNNNPVGFIDPSGQIAFGVAKRVIKLAIKGGDVAATFAGAIQDFNTVTDSNASVSDRLFAAASLASEIISPVSARDAKAAGNAISGVADRLTSGGGGADLPDRIYRGARRDNAKDVSLRPNEDAVSFRDSLTNPRPEPGEKPQPVLKPGAKFIEVDPKKLPEGSVIVDGGIGDLPPGHVSVKATPQQIIDATVGDGKFPKLSKEEKDRLRDQGLR